MQIASFRVRSTTVPAQGNRAQQPRTATAHSLAVAPFWLLTASAFGQSVTVDQRAIIDFGATGLTLAEPCVSATPARRLAICNSSTLVRGCTQGNQSSTWRAGSIPTLIYPDVCAPPGGACGTPSNPTTWVDPSCANVRIGGAASDTFIAVVEAAERVVISRYTYPAFSTWTTIADPVVSPSFADVDKPWVVAGGDNELYLVYMQTEGGVKYNFGRSTDGGLTWVFQSVAVAGVVAGGTFCSQPFVVDEGGCYLTITVQAPTRTQVLRYSDASATFDFIRDASGDPIAIPQNEVSWGGAGEIEGGYKCVAVPWLLGTTTGAGGLTSLFVIRPDAFSHGVEADTQDINLYCRRVQNNGPDGSWQVTATWEFRAPSGAMPDASGLYPDQFCHSAAMDSLGRMHVTCYDNSSARPTGSDLTGDYDVWHFLIPHPTTAPPVAPYMLSTNLRTVPSAEDPPLMSTDAVPLASPKEYSGIDTYFDPTTNQTVVWCLYAGTSTADDDPNKTVLFGSRLLIGP